MADYRGRVVLVRTRTKLEKARWEQVARRNRLPLAELVRVTMNERWLLEQQRKAVGE